MSDEKKETLEVQPINIYKGEELSLRKKNFRDFRLKGLDLLETYNKLRTEKISEEYENYAIKAVSEADKFTDEDGKLDEEAYYKYLEEKGEDTNYSKLLSYGYQKANIDEQFILNDKYASILLNMYFEDASKVKYDELNDENGEELDEYITFMLKLLNDFFLKMGRYKKKSTKP